MSQRKRGSYARVYAFGADSPIALYGGSVADVSFQPESLTRRSVKGRRGRGRRLIPAWAVLLTFAFVTFGMSMAYLGRCVQIAGLTKQVYRIREELARVTQTNEKLAVLIADKEDDTRIQTRAFNRLGMTQASKDRIFTVTPVSVPERDSVTVTHAEKNTEQKSGIGELFGLALHMIGL